jgi:N-acetyl-gamma-glutamylphosphate reductase
MVGRQTTGRHQLEISLGAHSLQDEREDNVQLSTVIVQASRGCSSSHHCDEADESKSIEQNHIAEFKTELQLSVST